MTDSERRMMGGNFIFTAFARVELGPKVVRYIDLGEDGGRKRFNDIAALVGTLSMIAWEAGASLEYFDLPATMMAPNQGTIMAKKKGGGKKKC